MATNVGEIFIYAGSIPPGDSLQCDGIAYSALEYPDLYAAIGTAWGGDGDPYFNVPNMVYSTDLVDISFGYAPSTPIWCIRAV